MSSPVDVVSDLIHSVLFRVLLVVAFVFLVGSDGIAMDSSSAKAKVSAKRCLEEHQDPIPLPTPTPPPDECDGADLNGDGSVDSVDQQIAQYAVSIAQTLLEAAQAQNDLVDSCQESWCSIGWCSDTANNSQADHCCGVWIAELLNPGTPAEDCDCQCTGPLEC